MGYLKLELLDYAVMLSARLKINLVLIFFINLTYTMQDFNFFIR